MSNVLDWAATVCSLLFVTPLLLNVKKTWHWQAGALASLISWVNLLLYLQRYINILMPSHFTVSTLKPVLSRSL